MKPKHVAIFGLSAVAGLIGYDLLKQRAGDTSGSPRGRVSYAGPDPERRKREHALSLAEASAARVVGVHQTPDGQWHVVPLSDHWQGAKWFMETTNYNPPPGAFAVWFNKDGPSWPYPSNEISGDDPKVREWNVKREIARQQQPQKQQQREQNNATSTRGVYGQGN